MDPDEVRAVAERMRSARHLLAARHSSLQGRVLGTSETWRGPDADGFRETWSSAVGPQWTRALERLGQLAETAELDAEEQDAASEPEGGTGHDAAGDGTASVRMLDGDAGDVPLDPEVQAAWREMTPEQKKAVLQEMVDREFERYGMEPVDISFFYEEPDEDGMVTYGSWSNDRGELRMNEYMLYSPDLALTTVHEVRHAAQHEFVEQTEGGMWDWLPWVDGPEADYERIEEEHGITREEIEAWRENSEPGNYISPEDDYEGYRAQPVEVDAREREDEFAGDLTLEDLQQYQRDAGVPVSEEP